MTIIRVTKEFNFEAAHALYRYDGLCYNIHGHSYRLFVTVTGSPSEDPSDPRNGMVMDFSELKKIVNDTVVHPFDHSLMLNASTPQAGIPQALEEKGVGMKIVLFDFQPTCEMMLAEIARRIGGRLPGHVRLHSLRLHETATSYAEWFADENRSA